MKARVKDGKSTDKKGEQDTGALMAALMKFSDFFFSTCYS